MKVWVVAADYDYEGYGAPEGVYSTKERAEAAIALYTGPGRHGIFELVIDLPIDA